MSGVFSPELELENERIFKRRKSGKFPSWELRSCKGSSLKTGTDPLDID